MHFACFILPLVLSFPQLCTRPVMRVPNLRAALSANLQLPGNLA